MKLPIQTQPVQRKVSLTNRLSQGLQNSQIYAQECIPGGGINCGIAGCPDGYTCEQRGAQWYCCK